MSAVEDEARQLLRWFPARWRQLHGEALVGTLLDAADAAGRDELTTVERRDLIANGIRERGAAVIPEAVRRQAAPIALGAGASLAAVQFVAVDWSPWSSRAWKFFSPIPYGFGPFTSAGAVIDALWLAAFVVGLLQLRRTMIAALGASAVASVMLYFAPLTSWSVGRPAATAMVVMALLAIVASSAPITARSFRPIAVVAAILCAGALVVFTWETLPRWGWGASRALVLQLDRVAPIGAVVLLVAVAVLSLTGLYRSAQAVLLALGPAWGVLLIRSQTTDGFLGVVEVAILTVVLVALGGRIPLRLRIERLSRPVE